MARRPLRSLGQTMTPTRSTGRLVSSRSVVPVLIVRRHPRHIQAERRHTREERSEIRERRAESGAKKRGVGTGAVSQIEEAEPQCHVTLFCLNVPWTNQQQTIHTACITYIVHTTYTISTTSHNTPNQAIVNPSEAGTPHTAHRSQQHHHHHHRHHRSDRVGSVHSRNLNFRSIFLLLYHPIPSHPILPHLVLWVISPAPHDVQHPTHRGRKLEQTRTRRIGHLSTRPHHLHPLADG